MISSSSCRWVGPLNFSVVTVAFATDCRKRRIFRWLHRPNAVVHIFDATWLQASFHGHHMLCHERSMHVQKESKQYFRRARARAFTCLDLPIAVRAELQSTMLHRVCI